jgi:hypothetical protein
MEKQELINLLNKVCKETNSSALLHSTELVNFESILKNNGIFPIDKILKINEELNIVYFDIGGVNIKSKRYKNYRLSTFFEYKTPSYNIPDDKILSNYLPITFILNPRDFDAKVFNSSVICHGWHYGQFKSGSCIKYKNELSLDENLNRYETYLIKQFNKHIDIEFMGNELVLKYPEGLEFGHKKIMIVIQMNLLTKEQIDYVKRLQKIYSHNDWVYLI